MHTALRLACLTAILLLLLVMRWGEASVILALFVAADLGAAALMLRPEPAIALVAALGAAPCRNCACAGQQWRSMRWRQAAQAHRRRREFTPGR